MLHPKIQELIENSVQELRGVLEENNRDILVELLEFLPDIARNGWSYSFALDVISENTPGLLEYYSVRYALSNLGHLLDGTHGIIRETFRLQTEHASMLIYHDQTTLAIIERVEMAANQLRATMPQEDSLESIQVVEGQPYQNLTEEGNQELESCFCKSLIVQNTEF